MKQLNVLVYQTSSFKDAEIVFNKLGFNLYTAKNIDDIYFILDNNYVDICILDYNYDREIGDKFGLVCKVRTFDMQMPIAMVVKDQEPNDSIRALKAGVDMFVYKPYNIEELAYRLNAIVMRGLISRQKPVKKLTQFGNYLFDYANKQFIDENDNSIDLSRNQADILRFMISYGDSLIDKNDILRYIWGSINTSYVRTLDATICGIRCLLKNCTKKIVTVRGCGYRIK